MAQDQTNEKDQVLIARNNETGETGAVKGLKQDGTPDKTPSKSAKLSDLVVFNIHKNPLEAFLSNFVRQCKNPSGRSSKTRLKTRRRTKPCFPRLKWK